MAVFIKKYVNNNKQSNAYGKTYGRVATRGTVDIEELAEEIQAKCTATRADVLAVLSALGESIRAKLLESKRVHIPYLGTFKLGVNTKGEENADNFNMRENILNVHVNFQPETTVDGGHRVKELLRGLRLAEMQKYVGVGGNDDDDGGTSGSGSGSSSGGSGETPVENRP